MKYFVQIIIPKWKQISKTVQVESILRQAALRLIYSRVFNNITKLTQCSLTFVFLTRSVLANLLKNKFRLKIGQRKEVRCLTNVSLEFHSPCSRKLEFLNYEWYALVIFFLSFLFFRPRKHSCYFDIRFHWRWFIV